MPGEIDYKVLWQRLKNHMTYLTQQGVTSLHPITVMECMDSISSMEEKYNSGYEDGYGNGTNNTKNTMQEWYDPTP